MCFQIDFKVVFLSGINSSEFANRSSVESGLCAEPPWLLARVYNITCSTPPPLPHSQV